MIILFYISVYIGISLLIFWLFEKFDKTLTEDDINFLGGVSFLWPITIPVLIAPYIASELFPRLFRKLHESMKR